MLQYILFIILFLLISLFPASLVDRFGTEWRIFALLFLLILALNKKYRALFFPRRPWLAGIFVLSLFAGVINAIDRGAALRSYLLIASTFFILFLVGRAVFSNALDKYRICITISSCALIVALLGLAEFYFSRNILYEYFVENPYYSRYSNSYSLRLMSTQLNPAILGSYLLGCLPFSFYLIRRATFGAGARTNHRKRVIFWDRLLGFASLSLSVIVMIMTYSRGVFLALVAMILFYLWLIHKKRIFVSFLIGTIFFIWFASLQEGHTFRRLGFQRMIIGSGDSALSDYRIQRLEMTGNVIRSHPFFGVGFNNFRSRFDEFCGGQLCRETSEEFRIPDNMYLTLFSETGIIGASGILFFIFNLFFRGTRGLKKVMDPENREALIVSLSAFFGILVHMAAYDLFYWSNPYMIFCLVSGFVSACSCCRRIE